MSVHVVAWIPQHARCCKTCCYVVHKDLTLVVLDGVADVARRLEDGKFSLFRQQNSALSIRITGLSLILHHFSKLTNRWTAVYSQRLVIVALNCVAQHLTVEKGKNHLVQL